MRFNFAFLLATASTCASLGTPADQIPISEYGGTLEAVRKVLQKADIIDEVLDDFQPKCFVAPFYGKKHRPVTLGNIFKQSKTKERPGLGVYCPDIQSTPGLTIALTDPDAKSRDDPKWSEMCHWIGIITISNHTDFEFYLASDSDDEDLVEYKPPGPPPKTGYHRYVFVLLEGDTTNLTAPEERQHWGTGKVRHGVRDWAKREELQVVGANFFIERNKKQ